MNFSVVVILFLNILNFSVAHRTTHRLQSCSSPITGQAKNTFHSDAWLNSTNTSTVIISFFSDFWKRHRRFRFNFGLNCVLWTVAVETKGSSLVDAMFHFYLFLISQHRPEGHINFQRSTPNAILPCTNLFRSWGDFVAGPPRCFAVMRTRVPQLSNGSGQFWYSSAFADPSCPSCPSCQQLWLTGV